jgi:hypothetical protein
LATRCPVFPGKIPRFPNFDYFYGHYHPLNIANEPH